MNLFCRNPHAPGYGAWKNNQRRATLVNVAPKIYMVREIEGDPHNYHRQFDAGELAEGWFTSESDALTDCSFVRQLLPDEYDVHEAAGNFGRPPRSNYVRVQRGALLL